MKRQIFNALTFLVLASATFTPLRLLGAESEQVLKPIPKPETLFDASKNDLLSPFNTRASVYFYSGAALTLAFAIFEDATDPIQNEAIEQRPLGDIATKAGSYSAAMIPNIAYSLGMIAYGYSSQSRDARERGYTMARASLYAQGMTAALKSIVHEPRPDKSGEHDSFPSGHTTNAFSFASVVSAEHNWYWGALAYSYATVVAYGRINDNRHLTHDVVGGAVVGLSYGLGLYYRQIQRSELRAAIATSDPSSTSFQILPTSRLDGALAMFTRDF